MPSFRPAASRQSRVRDLVQAGDDRVALQRAVGGHDGADVPVGVALEGLGLRAEVQRHAARLERVVDGLGDVGVEDLVQHPRPLVDEVDLQPAVREAAGHLDADRAGADDDDPLHRVELLVELHRLADVLDVVDAVEVHARHVGLLPEEAGAEDELVEALGLVLRRDRAPVEVDVGDDRLHAHVQAVLAVALDGGQEEVVEARDLAAVDERDAARRVGDVRELGEDAHLELRVQALGDGRGRRPRAASADDDYALHGDSSRSKWIRSESSSRRRCRRQVPPSRATTAGRRSPNSVDWTCW